MAAILSRPQCVNGLISIIDTQVPTLVHVLLNDVYNLSFDSSNEWQIISFVGLLNQSPRWR